MLTSDFKKCDLSCILITRIVNSSWNKKSLNFSLKRHGIRFSIIFIAYSENMGKTSKLEKEIDISLSTNFSSSRQ